MWHFVDKNLSYKVLEGMLPAASDLIECITIEICIKKKKKKNVIISCVYRTPGSNAETFLVKMEETFAKLNQKVMFICGDFNIDLLK